MTEPNEKRNDEPDGSDPFIETDKKLLALEKDVAELKAQLKNKEIMMNKVIATNKQLLTDLNNVPSKPEPKQVSKDKVLEDSFFKSLGINKEK